MNNVKTLDALREGERARVKQVSGDDGIAMRLMEMGLTDGEEVLFVATAPFGDPIEFALRGYRLSLRKAEAARVLVEPVDT